MTTEIVLRCLILGAIALVAVAAMRRTSASARHAVLATAFAVTLILPVVRFVPKWPVSIPVERIGRVTPRGLGETFLARIASGPESTTHASTLRETASWIWGVGCAVVAFRIFLAHLAALRIRRRSTRRGDVLVSGDIDAPMVIGIVTPQIVVPVSFDEWSSSHQHSVLAHERAHVRRRDALVQLVADAALSIYWFNPLLWIAAARLRLESERACDDAVVATGSDPQDYASVLVALASRASRVPIAVAPISRCSDLERRVTAIFDQSIVRTTPGKFTRAAIVVLAMLFTIPLAATSAREIREIVDPFLDPLTERVTGQRDTVPQVHASVSEDAVIDALRIAAQRTPTWRGDLVADRARWALARVEDGQIVEPMIRALKDDDWRVRGYAAWTLGYARDRRATESLIPLLDHPVWRLRASAAFALHHIADPRAARAMDRALGDDAWQVRIEAVSYFAAIGDVRRIAAMRSDRHLAVRMTVAEALGQ